MSPKIAHKQMNSIEIRVTRSLTKIPPFSGIRRIIGSYLSRSKAGWDPSTPRDGELTPEGAVSPQKPMEKSRFWATF